MLNKVIFTNNDKSQEFVITLWRGESNEVEDLDTTNSDLDTLTLDLDTLTPTITLLMPTMTLDLDTLTQI